MKKRGYNVPEHVDTGTSILVEDVLIRDETQTVFELLQNEVGYIIFVSTNFSGERYLERYDEVADDRRGIRVIDASGDASSSDERLTPVSSPEDLTTIGVKISEILDDYKGEEGICLCFDSVSGMLTMMATETVFRFLHVVTGQIRSVEGLGMFGIRPEIHDSQELATIQQLFDGRLVRGDDGLVFRYGGFNV